MSLHLPARRAFRSVASLTTVSTTFPLIQRRTLLGLNFGRNKKKDSKKTAKEDLLTEAHLTGKDESNQELPTRGGLQGSILGTDSSVAQKAKKQKVKRNPASMAAVLDPDPTSRKRWERKMVIREITKRGRMTRAQQLKRSERVLLSKSHDFKTSVKKLNPLARQIVGKTVEDAIVQMRFSKKKAAAEVKLHLEHAKNEAIVKRGMGLGMVKGGPDEGFKPIKVQTKDKKTVKVFDPTTLYVDQAWVGKGLFTKSLDYRARGRAYYMINPTTSLSLILKEEKTRIREHEERQEKLRNRKVWQQLPNRPITAQRQYYSW